MTRELPTGILPTATGYRAVVWVPDPRYPKGRVPSKCFPAGTPLDTMVAWRLATRAAAEARVQQTAARDTTPEGFGFLADAERYLQTVRALPSWAERRRELRAWAAAFGDRPTATITPTLIRATRDQWLTVGPKRVQARQPNGQMAWVDTPRPLAPQSVNLRLRALENFFTVLFPAQDNPVREVDECTPPDPQPRGETFSLGLEILSFMPDTTRPVKGGAVEPGSHSRARFAVMLFTGLSAKQVGRLKPEHIDWTVPCFQPPSRLKGRRGATRQRGRPRVVATRPLLPEAVEALKQLFAVEAHTPFKSSSITRSVKRAIAKANRVRAARQLPLIPATLRIYDLTRHTFGTEVFRATKSEAHVQQLLGHSDVAMSRRYALAAVREDLVLGMAELAKRARAARPVPAGRPRTRSTTLQYKVSPPAKATVFRNRTGGTSKRLRK